MLSVRIQMHNGSLVAEHQWDDARSHAYADRICSAIFASHHFDTVGHDRSVLPTIGWLLDLGSTESEQLILDLLNACGDLFLYGPVDDPQEADYRIIIEAPR